MKNRLTILAAAAALALTGLQVNAQQTGSNSPSYLGDIHQYANDNQKLDDLIPNDGAKVQADSRDPALRQAALDTANAVIGTDNPTFSQVVTHLASADQQRLSSFPPDADKELAQAVQKLRADFKAKFGRDINLAANSTVFEGFAGITADVTDPSKITHWPVPSMYGTSTDLGATAQQSSPQQQQQQASGAQTASATNAPGNNLKAGDKIGLIRVAGPDKKTTRMILSFDNEGGTWKLDVPQAVQSKYLVPNLVNHVKWADQHLQAFGPDVGIAEHHVTIQVLMALVDVEGGTHRQSTK